MSFLILSDPLMEIIYAQSGPIGLTWKIVSRSQYYQKSQKGQKVKKSRKSTTGFFLYFVRKVCK